MSLRLKLTWAFIGVVFAALVLAFSGLNVGMWTTMMGAHHSDMMAHDQMMSAPGLLRLALRWSLGSSLAAFAVAGAAGYWTAERITRSVRNLKRAAANLDLRTLSHRVPVEGNDEIAELAGTFNRMCDRLEAEERSRRQLLADTAHELRHPLAVLQGRLELMQEGQVELDQEALLPLQDQVIRLTRLVTDLRELSLAEVGQLSLHMAPVDLGALLQGLVDNLEPVAAAREITLAARVAPDLPVITADADRLRQVFVNLLTNALRYTPQAGRVEVAAWAEGGQVHVKVADTGSGIAAEDLPHIFDRFYRADKARSRSSGGSGLGLAIVRSLTELHQGQVKVESTPGSGTSFVVSLRAAPQS